MPTDSQVAVLEDGRAHFRKVTVTRDFGTTVDVSDGIKAGDQVILDPRRSIFPKGARCRLVRKHRPQQKELSRPPPSMQRPVAGPYEASSAVPIPAAA